jgi:hypothetical protein
MNEIDVSLFPSFAKSFPDRVYHYTTIGGLHGILSCGIFRASDVSYMNDTSELSYSYSVFRERHPENLRATFRGVDDGMQEHSLLDPVKAVTDSLQRAPSNVMFCAACFCGARDELSQWRAYGDRGGGCALVFNGRLLQANVRRQPRLIAGPIIYCPKQQYAVIDALEREHGGDVTELIRKFGYIAPFMKNPVFQQEEEWRIGRFHNSDIERRGGELSNLIDFRTSKGMFVPFACLDLTDESPRRLPIVEVMLGPTLNSGAAERSMRLYLDIGGYEDVKISRSAVPIRF